MEQRVYRGGNANAEGLANFLVQHYDPQHDLQAQKLGEGNSLVVQIARGDEPTHKRDAVTIGISQSEEQGLVVTIGEQQWIDPSMIGYVVMMGMVSLLVTPWALFALVWPASRILGNRVLPNDIWSMVETYAIGQGAIGAGSQTLQHPHAR